MRVTILINPLTVASEVFVEFHTGGSHTSAARYLYFTLHGHHAPAPWIWTSAGTTIVAALFLPRPRVLEHRWMLNAACLLAFAGIGIEKGMGHIIPGFVPSTLHEIVEHLPNGLEWKITAGLWALGLTIFTIALKILLAVLQGTVRDRSAPKAAPSQKSPARRPLPPAFLPAGFDSLDPAGAARRPPAPRRAPQARFGLLHPPTYKDPGEFYWPAPSDFGTHDSVPSDAREAGEVFA